MAIFPALKNFFFFNNPPTLLEEVPKTLGFSFSKYLCVVKKYRLMKNVIDLTPKNSSFQLRGEVRTLQQVFTIFKRQV